MAELISFSDFLRSRVGKNWVLARRSSGIVRRYGDDVTCLSQKQYAALRAEWTAGHPATAAVAELPGEIGEWVREMVRDNLEYYRPQAEQVAA